MRHKLIEGIQQIKEVFPEIDEQSLIDSINNYKMVVNLHTTIAYLGFKTIEFMEKEKEYKSEEEKKRVIELLDNFRIGEDIEFKLMGFAMIDDKIITGLVGVDKQKE